MKLNDALWNLTNDSLKTLITVADLKKAPTRKADRIAFLNSHLQDPTFWAQLVKQRLSALQRAAIAHIVHDGWPRWDPQRFHAIHGELPDLGRNHFDFWNFSGKAREHSPMELIFFNTMDSDTIPDELQALLKPLVAPPSPVALPTLDALPEVVHDVWEDPRTREIYTTPLPLNLRLRELGAGQELAAILQLAQAGKLRFTDKTGLPTAATTRAVQALMATPDYLLPPDEWGNLGGNDLTVNEKDLGPIRGFAWPMLLKAAGFLQLNGGTSSLLSASGRRAIAAPLPETLRAIFNAWMKEDSFDELSRIHQIKGQGGKGQRRLTPPPERRARIACALRELPIGAWVQAHDLLRLMIVRQIKPTVLKGYPDGLYLGEVRYGSLMNAGDTFDLLEGSFTRCFLMEFAATLGVVDVAYLRPDLGPVDFSAYWGGEDLTLCPYNGLTHIRLTPLGAHLLGALDNYTPSIPRPSAPLRVLPNLDVVVVGTPEPQVALILDLFAERTAETTWRLTRHGLLDAIDAGHPLATLVGLLSGDPESTLPSTTLDLLADVKKRSAALRDEGLWHVVLADDPAVAAELGRHTTTRKACRLIGDRHLLVQPDKVASFRKAIVALGFGAQIAPIQS